MAVYLSVFVVRRRPVALRLHRLGYVVVAALVTAAAGTTLGRNGLSTSDAAILGAVSLVSIALLFARRAWLIRQSPATWRDEIFEACRRLFISVQEPRDGVFVLGTRDGSCRLRWFRLGPRVLLVVFPRPVGRDKVSLLLEWLHKEYPGPIPRIRISPKEA